MTERTINSSGVDVLPDERRGASSVIELLSDQIAVLQRENEFLRSVLCKIMKESPATEIGRLAMEAITGMEVTDVTE